jgi:tRNA-intron endonuclease
VSQKELMKRFEKIDKKFRTKYLVFKDLRSRGLIVKTALKFGAEFRVYEKGKNIGKDHAKWILFPIAETEQLTWHDFSAKNRVAHSTKKNLLIAIVDEENDVSYYEVKWIRP